MTYSSDAAWANKPNDVDSMEGILARMSTPRLPEAMEGNVAPVFWRSAKIDRVCRSPAAAETIAAFNGEDDLFSLRILWCEIFKLNICNLNEGAKCTKDHLISDAKCVQLSSQPRTWPLSK